MDRPKRQPRRHVPFWLVLVAVLAVSPLIGAGVFAIGNYIVAHTTVTVDLVSWSVPLRGGSVYEISCQSSNGVGTCPYHVKPGSVFSTTVYIAIYPGMNVSLYAPPPFSLASTSPGLPVTVPSAGISIGVNLTLPSAPGEYSFTGNVTFS